MSRGGRATIHQQEEEQEEQEEGGDRSGKSGWERVAGPRFPLWLFLWRDRLFCQSDLAGAPSMGGRECVLGLPVAASKVPWFHGSIHGWKLWMSSIWANHDSRNVPVFWVHGWGVIHGKCLTTAEEEPVMGIPRGAAAAAAA